MKVIEAIKVLTNSNDYIEVIKHHYRGWGYYQTEILYIWDVEKWEKTGDHEEIFDENYGEKEVEEIYAFKLGCLRIIIE